MKTGNRHSLSPWSLDESAEQELIKKIISFFHTNRDEEIGVLASQELLDFFTSTLAPEVYRKALVDARALLDRHNDAAAEELELMIVGAKENL